jgi:hypothetical protein
MDGETTRRMAPTAEESRLVFAGSCQEPAEGLDYLLDGAD